MAVNNTAANIVPPMATTRQHSLLQHRMTGCGCGAIYADKKFKSRGKNVNA